MLFRIFCGLSLAAISSTAFAGIGSVTWTPEEKFIGIVPFYVDLSGSLAIQAAPGDELPPGGWGGPSSQVTVDWGDGTVDIRPVGEAWSGRTHTYTDRGSFNVTVTILSDAGGLYTSTVNDYVNTEVYLVNNQDRTILDIAVTSQSVLADSIVAWGTSSDTLYVFMRGVEEYEDRSYLRAYPGEVVSAVSLGDDGNFVAAGTSGSSAGHFFVYSFPDFTSEIDVSAGAEVSDIDVADDESLIAVGAEDGDVFLYTVSGTTPSLDRTLSSAHAAGEVCVALASDGSLLATGGVADRLVQLWDPSTGDLLHSEESEAGITAVAFSDDDALVVAGNEDGVLFTLDASTHDVVDTLTTAHSDAVKDLDDTATGFISSGADGLIQDLTSSLTVSHTYRNHTGGVYAASLLDETGTEPYMVSGGEDEILRFWDPSTRRVEERYFPEYDGLRWDTAFEDPGDALKKTRGTPYDTYVWIREGTYTAQRPFRKGALPLRRNVNLYGGFDGSEESLDPETWDPDPADTIIDGSIADKGEPAEHVFTGSNSVTLANVTISGGVTLDEGAGLYARNVEDLTIKQCAFTDNVAFKGHDVFLQDSSVTFLETTFNSETDRGVAFLSDHSDIVLSECVFEVTTPTVYSNVFLQVQGGTADLDQTQFLTGSRTGVLMGGDATVDRCLFQGLIGTVFHNEAHVTTTITNSLIADNALESLSTSQPLIENENFASLTLNYCTISNNTSSPLVDELLHSGFGSELYIHNTIIWGNEDNPGGDAGFDEVFTVFSGMLRLFDLPSESVFFEDEDEILLPEPSFWSVGDLVRFPTTADLPGELDTSTDYEILTKRTVRGKAYVSLTTVGGVDPIDFSALASQTVDETLYRKDVTEIATTILDETSAWIIDDSGFDTDSDDPLLDAGYELQPGSPAVDAGSAVGSVVIDYAGVVRPVGGANDVGCYEQE